MHAALKTLFLFISEVLVLTSFYSYYPMSRDGNTCVYLCLFWRT